MQQKQFDIYVGIPEQGNITTQSIFDAVRTRFDGCTINTAKGMWNGVVEWCWVVTIFALEQDWGTITGLATDLRDICNQDCVYLAVSDTHASVL